ncbi:MAG: alpha/beta hydrolase [Marinilabiliales bacterium]|nr:MAG: alpha/beta hydrolase [Marinilabiliales bacterium]
MPSLSSKLFIFLIRNRQIFKGKLKREIIDDSFSVEKFRARIDKASAKMRLAKGTKAENTDINGMYAEWIIPENAPEEKVLLYIHGGGFISGSCLTHRMHVSKFAKGTGIKCLLFDYRLSPEHPFPAAVEDCLKAYRFLLDSGFKPENIVIGGESAGATLTLSLLLKLKQLAFPQPKAAFSISPLTDASCSAKSFEYNYKNDVAPKNSWKIWTEMYIAGHDTTDPLLSPQFGHFKGIPPIHLTVGSYEIHLDDCRKMAEVLKRDDVELTYKEWPNMVHAFPLLSPLFPEAKNALDEICGFVKKNL